MAYARMFEVKQHFPARCLTDISGAVKNELRRINLRGLVRTGWEVAIAASARGIRDQAIIIKSLVEELKDAGAKPFIIPAMGSHGGATAEGQAAVLEAYGITEKAMGAPVRSSIEADLVGATSQGVAVYADSFSLAVRGIVLVNRIKAHIDFEGPQESGLYKMIVAGLGKPKGAQNFHLHAQEHGYYSLLREMALFALSKLPILAGIGIVEDAYGQTETVTALSAEEMKEGSAEAVLLRRAKENMAKLPLNEIDILIIDEIGKDIAGSGADTNVIGRKGEPHTWPAQRPSIKRIVIRDLTEMTQGNALGIGYADFVTNRLVDKMDHHKTYVNALTANALHEAKIPIIMSDDKGALEAAFNTIGPVKPEAARVVRIKNTRDLTVIEASEACLSELKDKANIQIAQGPRELNFDGDGFLPPL